MNVLGDFLKSLRDEHGLTPAQVAQAAQIAPITIERWERGDFQPGTQTLLLVLGALKATQEQRIRGLTLIEAPRSGGALHREYQIPTPGRLWYLLRLRRGLSGTELADQVGVRPYHVTRWERDAAYPSEPLLSRLLDALQALPEERDLLGSAAASAGKLATLDTLTPATPVSLDEYEERIEDLWPHLFSAKPLAFELTALQLETALLLRRRLLSAGSSSAKEERAAYLLARLYNMMAERLTLRPAAARGKQFYVGEGWQIVQQYPNSADMKPAWMALLFQKGSGLSNRDRFKFLESCLAGAQDRQWRATRSQMYREMAQCAGRMGYYRQAFAQAKSAQEDAEESGELDYIRGSRLAYGHLLIATKRGAEAMEYLIAPPASEEEENDLVVACDRHLDWAEAYLVAGERVQAHTHLNHYERLSQLGGGTLYKRAQADRLVQQLESRQ